MGRKVWKSHEANCSNLNSAKHKYGYARVSTDKQTIQRQIDDIHAICPEAIIYFETFTGTKSERPEWQRLLQLCRQGKVSEIWFCDVSRMSRNKKDGYETWKELYELGVDLHFITTPQIDTTTYKEALQRTLSISNVSSDDATNEFMQSILSAINNYMIRLAQKQIYIAFEEAEQEAKDLSQRTKEGIEVARIKGSKIGRQEGVTLNTWKRRKSIRKIKKYYIKYGGIVSAEDCIKICEISKSTFYRYVSEIDDELKGNNKKFTYRSKCKH